MATKPAISESVPTVVQAQRWPTEAPVAWDQFVGEVVAVIDVCLCGCGCPRVQWSGGSVVTNSAVPLTPFCRDLMAALKAGG